MRSRLPTMFLERAAVYAAPLDSPAYQNADSCSPRGRVKVNPKRRSDHLPRRRFQRHLKARRWANRLRILHDVLVVGNWLYDAVHIIEHNWRTEVIEGKTPYDASEETAIMEFYRLWGQPCQRVISEIHKLRSKGHEVRGGEVFEANFEKASAILAGENPFYDDVDRAGLWAARTARFRQSPRPVRIDEAGRIFELSGERFVMPGLSPDDILQAMDDERAGRKRSLKDVLASRISHGL